MNDRMGTGLDIMKYTISLLLVLEVTSGLKFMRSENRHMPLFKNVNLAANFSGAKKAKQTKEAATPKTMTKMMQYCSVWLIPNLAALDSENLNHPVMSGFKVGKLSMMRTRTKGPRTVTECTNTDHAKRARLEWWVTQSWLSSLEEVRGKPPR